MTGFALKTSDANVDIILPKGESASQALVIIYKYLKEKGMKLNKCNYSFHLPSYECINVLYLPFKTTKFMKIKDMYKCSSLSWCITQS